MPKENTHLFFAGKLLEKWDQQKFSFHIKGFKKEFYLGSVFPDAFFYHPKKAVQVVSSSLHGIGNDPYQIIIHLLSEARRQSAYADLSFVFGYLSHCALDGMFHPVIEKISKIYADQNPNSPWAEKYKHRILETALDKQINGRFYMEQMIDISRLSKLVSLRLLLKKMKISERDLRVAFWLQYTANRLFTRRWTYLWTKLFTSLINNCLIVILPLFYAHLETSNEKFPREFSMPTSKNDFNNTGNLSNLFSKTESLTQKLFSRAYLFFKDRDRADCCLTELQSYLSETG